MGVMPLADLARSMNLITPTRRFAPATSTPVRLRPEVRRFLRGLLPELLDMLDGVYDVLPTSNGTGASAYSATELLKHVTFSLVSQGEVNAYVSRTYPQGRRKHHTYELIALKHGLDAQIVMSLTHGGHIVDELNDIKHDWQRVGSGEARARLMPLIEDVESLLVYLAQAVG